MPAIALAEIYLGIERAGHLHQPDMEALSRCALGVTVIEDI